MLDIWQDLICMSVCLVSVLVHFWFVLACVRCSSRVCPSLFTDLICECSVCWIRFSAWLSRFLFYFGNVSVSGSRPLLPVVLITLMCSTCFVPLPVCVDLYILSESPLPVFASSPYVECLSMSLRFSASLNNYSLRVDFAFHVVDYTFVWTSTSHRCM